MPPFVAVTTDRREQGPQPTPGGPRVRPPLPEVYLKEAVVVAIRAAGAEPLLLAPHDGTVAPLVRWVIDRVDAVVITGGAVDLHPAHYGETVTNRLDRVDEGRAALELTLARACLDADLPLLGLCGGMQTLAVVAGGTLHQDISACVPGASEHEQLTDPATPWHPVHLEAGPLRSAFGSKRIEVNSTHHQAVHDPGALAVGGWAPDGVVEAVYHPERQFAVGVQWHPELLGEAGMAPFRALIAATQVR